MHDIGTRVPYGRWMRVWMSVSVKVTVIEEGVFMIYHGLSVSDIRLHYKCFL